VREAADIPGAGLPTVGMTSDAWQILALHHHLGPAISSSTSSSSHSLRMGLSVSTFMCPNRHVPKLAFAPEPVELPIKPDQEDQKTMPMDAFVSKSCPSLYQPYDPPRWMHKYVGWSAFE
jgi:hypothetical protein